MPLFSLFVLHPPHCYDQRGRCFKLVCIFIWNTANFVFHYPLTINVGYYKLLKLHKLRHLVRGSEFFCVVSFFFLVFRKWGEFYGSFFCILFCYSLYFLFLFFGPRNFFLLRSTNFYSIIGHSVGRDEMSVKTALNVVNANVSFFS